MKRGCAEVAAIADIAACISRSAVPLDAFDAHFDAVGPVAALANLGKDHPDFGLKGPVAQAQAGRNGEEFVAAGEIAGGEFTNPGRPIGDSNGGERFERRRRIGADLNRRGHGPVHDGGKFIGTAGRATGADPAPGGFFRVGLGGEPELHDGAAWGDDGIDLPGRCLGHDEFEGPAERDAQAAPGEPLHGVGPERFEEQGALEAGSEDIAIDGRIFPPTGFVAIELIGHDSVECARRGQFVFGL